MNELINIKKADGTSVSGSLICYIENTTTKKRYVYYTLNETVGVGAGATVKIYVDNVVDSDATLNTPISDEEWGILKGYMGEALKDVNNPSVKYLPLNGLTELNVVSERAIAMPIDYDYINKQRNIYATAVANSVSDTAQVAEPVSEPAVQQNVEPVVGVPTQDNVVSPEPQAVEPVAIQSPINTEPVVNVLPTEPVVQEAPTALVEPVVSETVVPEPIAQPVVETPLEGPVAPVQAQVMPEATVEQANVESTPLQATTLEPIDIATIEAKYAEMIVAIEKLKEQELEAAKRYNATLELSQMHNEQHASYVQNEQIKETVVDSSASEPVINPTPMVGQVQEPIPVEPTPVTPVNIETNWFDMPNNAA